MGGSFSRFLDIILITVMLVIIPINALAQTIDLTYRRTVLNQTCNFIDKIADTGQVTEDQKAAYMLAISQTNLLYDVKIERQAKVVTPRDTKDGQVVTTDVSYVTIPDATSFNKGDIVIVRVRALTATGASKLLYRFSRFLLPPIEDVEARVVRY